MFYKKKYGITVCNLILIINMYSEYWHPLHFGFILSIGTLLILACPRV